MKVRLGNYIQEYSVRNRTEEDIPVYSVTNTEGFCTGYFDKDVASNDRSTYKIVPRGCFAYNPSRINVGSVDWQQYEDRVIVSPLYVVFSVSDGLLPQYLYYYLKSNVALTFIRATATGSVRDNLRFSMLQEFSIEMRSVEEQMKVAQTLDSIQKLIKLYKRQLRTLDTLIKARFVEMFGNDDTYLKHAQHIVADVCESRVGIVIQPTQYYTEDKDRGIRAFRSMNVKPFTVYDQEWVYFSKEDNDRLARTQIHANDVAVVRSGANLGDSCVISEEFEGCNAIDILLLTCSKQVLPVYLCAFINYPVGKSQILNVQRGGAIKHLNLRQLEQSAIYIPPLEEQYKFTDFVSQVDKSKVAVQEALNKAQLLFDSLMQQYFG